MKHHFGNSERADQEDECQVEAESSTSRRESDSRTGSGKYTPTSTRRQVLQGAATFSALGLFADTAAARSSGVVETGTAYPDQPSPDSWKKVPLDQTFNDPVVMIGPITKIGSHPCHVRLRDVTGDSFKFKLEEWDYLDGSHKGEIVHYVVIESGTHYSDNDSYDMVAGTKKVDDRFRTVSTDHYFSASPVVFTQPQTYNGPDAIVTKTKKVTGEGEYLSFDVRVQEEEAKGTHNVETVGYLGIETGTDIFNDRAYEVGSTPNVVTDEWHRIAFERSYQDPRIIADIQTNNGWQPAGLRHVGPLSSSASVLIEEEQSADSETQHTSESVGYMVVEAAKEAFDGEGEAGVLAAEQRHPDTWHTAEFVQSYNDPVLITGPLSNNGNQQCHVRLRNVTGDNFEFKLEEWTNMDQTHTAERFYYMVLESGYHSTDNYDEIDAGTVETNDLFTTVSSSDYYGSRPIVLTQPQTYNGSQPIVSRLRNVSGPDQNYSFDVRVQEEEANGRHATETIGYIVFETSTDTFHSSAFEAQRTSDSVTNTWDQITLQQNYESPIFLADIQTYDGPDTAGLRYKDLTGAGVDVFVEEDQSADSETYHTTESIGYVVVDNPFKQ